MGIELRSKPLLRPSAVRWLNQPTSRRQFVVGWVVATMVFVGLIYFLGGPTQSDAISTNYPTWAIAHGEIACAYPPAQYVSFPQVDTLYPLIAGGLSAILGIGHATAFPAAAQLGHNCSHATSVIEAWSTKAHVLKATARLALIGWLFLTAGVVLFLRTTERRRTRWEFAALMLMAISPPILDGIYVDLHPEDFIALGLALMAVVAGKKNRWLLAGLLIGFAVTSQQFALLVAAPLFVIAPHRQKVRYAIGAAASFLSIVTGLAIATSGRSIKASLIGSGFTPAAPGTLVQQFHIATTTELTLSRATPIILSTLLAWWVWHRFGERVFEPEILAPLIAVSLVLRIVFDPNLWGYYCLATTVGIILVDIIRGRIRMSFFLWLSIILLVYGPWNNSPLFYGMPYWKKQLIIVPFAVFLVSGSLLDQLRSRRHHVVHGIEGLDEEPRSRVVDAS